MSDNGKFSTAGKNFTLPPALTALTNSTSDWEHEESSNQRLWPLQADTEKCCLIGPVKQSIYIDYGDFGLKRLIKQIKNL